MWSGILEKEDGNAPLTAELYEMASLETRVVGQLPVVSHDPHQVPTK